MAEVKCIYCRQSEKMGFFKHMKSSQEIVGHTEILMGFPSLMGFSHDLHFYENVWCWKYKWISWNLLGFCNPIQSPYPLKNLNKQIKASKQKPHSNQPTKETKAKETLLPTSFHWKWIMFSFILQHKVPDFWMNP